MIMQVNDMKTMLESANRALKAKVTEQAHEIATLQASLKDKVNAITNLEQNLKIVHGYTITY